MAFQLVVAMVKSELTDRIVQAAKGAGAPGSTVLPAHGTGIHEAKTFFGMDLEIASDVILFLLTAELADKVLQAIRQEGRFDEPGTGIAFVIPVDRVVGLQGQNTPLQHMKKS